MSVKRLGALVVALGLLGALIPATALAAGSSYWNVAGTYGVNVTWNQDTSPGTVYTETLILTQSGTGTITGTSICLACFTITGGSVVDNTITFTGVYGALTTNFTAMIAPDGSMSGTWADVAPGTRTGTWATSSGAAVSVTTNTHEKSDLVPAGTTGPAVGAVIFNSSAGSTNNLEMTLQLRKVTPNTSYDVYLFLDQWGTSINGFGHPLGTLVTNAVGNGTFHVNAMVPSGVHTVGVDVVRSSDTSGTDVYVTPGLYAQNLFMYFQ